MLVKIDWLSFTLETEVEPKDASDLGLIAQKLVNEVGRHVAEQVFDRQVFSQAPGRTPYRIGLANADNTIRIYGGSHTGTILLELSGRGCVGLSNLPDAQRFVDSVAARITRFDTAVDIRQPTAPDVFVKCGYSKRFKHTGHVRSKTGHTIYIGSPKSDRFARVYRYYKPHPRHEFLRIEYVFRRKLATIAAEAFCSAQSWLHYAAQLGETWAWGSDIYDTGCTDDIQRLPGEAYGSKADSETVAWLYNQVAPAMQRLVNAGSFDMAAFLEYVYTGIVPDNVKFGAKLRK